MYVLNILNNWSGLIKNYISKEEKILAMEGEEKGENFIPFWRDSLRSIISAKSQMKFCLHHREVVRKKDSSLMKE